MSALGMSGWLCNALSIVSTEDSTESSSFKVVHWCGNTLDCSWKDMSELVWMGNSVDSIYMYLVEEYVMSSCRYTTVKSHHKVVPNLVEAWYSLEQYIGLKEDKLSSTTVDFIRSEGNLETKHLYWFSKPKMC